MTELKTLEKTHQREKKSLVQHNLELRNTVRSLKVSAAYVHLTALLLGAVIFLCITGKSE
jgi:hypothetical protein